MITSHMLPVGCRASPLQLAVASDALPKHRVNGHKEDWQCLLTGHWMEPLAYEVISFQGMLWERQKRPADTCLKMLLLW